MEDSEDVYTVNSNRKIKLNKDSWYNVLVYKENSTEKDIEVNIRVSNVELRIEFIFSLVLIRWFYKTTDSIYY